jgi:hypothetical protein
VALTTHPHLATRLKKGYSYTFTPPLGPRGLLLGELHGKQNPNFVLYDYGFQLFNNLKENGWKVYHLFQIFDHGVCSFRVINRTNRYVCTAIDGLVFITETLDASFGVRTEIYNKSCALRTVNMPYR